MPNDMDLTPLLYFYLIISAAMVLFAIIIVIATWRILKKMDKPGVLALIPFVGWYVVFKGCWGSRCAKKYVFALVIMYIAMYVGLFAGQSFSPDGYVVEMWDKEMMIVQLLTNEITFAQFVAQMGTLQCVCMLIELIALVYILLLSIGFSFRLAKAFEYGFFFGLGLLLMPYLFYLILAFGGSEYDESYAD